MSTEPNEFERSEKTPADVIITDKEVTIVRGGVRTIVKMAVPFVPKLAVSIGAALVAWILSVSHTDAGKAATDEKIGKVSDESEATTKRAYKGLSEPADKIRKLLADHDRRLATIEANQAAQSALIVAREKDFIVEGKPASRRVDPGLVKAVKANAAKDSKDLAARKSKPVPVIAPIPLELPPAPTKPAAAPAPTATQPAQDAAKP